MRVKLTLPDGIDPATVQLPPGEMVVVPNFDLSRPIGRATVSLENGELVADLDLEASLSVTKNGDETRAMSVGLIRMPARSAGDDAPR